MSKGYLIGIAAGLAIIGGAVTWRSGEASPSSSTPQLPVSVALPAQNSKVPVSAAIRLNVADTGNEVRYRIREQLVRLPRPNDAIGKTAQVSGGISISEDGRIVAGESKFVVNAAGLTSDSDRRDNFVRRRVLETEQFPTVEFAALSVRGLPSPLPKSGTHTFELIGNLTVRGVTRPTRWQVTATPAGQTVKGSAVTAFTFTDFKIDQPRVPVVLSVADTIRLEYDFNLTGTR
ncbi:MAG TPA: YceI family protein [Gemmatimonadaceae bacterium]|nr:YceI family protein [Gemmatimonadaceae bacterium]